MKSVRRGWLGSEMFTRLTATVTISAPEASTAAAFSSRLLYLPVPTISRDMNVRPATVQVSACMAAEMFTSSPSDEMDDFIIIAVFDLHRCERGARDNLEVPLDRYAQGVQAELVQEIGDAQIAGHPAVFAVDPDSKASIETH